MPHADTFSIAPIRSLLERVLIPSAVVVDPFARNSRLATYRNDLNPETTAEHHMDAEAFCDLLAQKGIMADAVLFDPPYSPRQIAEVYASVGRKVSTADTQNAALYRRVRQGLNRLLRAGGIAVSCGWNSNGFGLSLGFEPVELLLVAHGGAHNDTLVLVERKIQSTLPL
jgi:hypothetical protein